MESTREQSLLTASSIAIGETGTLWRLFINGPTANSLANVNEMRISSIGIAATFLLLLALLISFMAKVVIVRPLNNVIAGLTAMSQSEGDLDPAADYQLSRWVR
jgi:hypothetical protein